MRKCCYARKKVLVFEPNEDWLPVKAVLEKPIKPDQLLTEIEKHLK